MKIDVGHVAKLANLPLKPHEERKFEKQLSEILSYVEKLKEVDTKNVEITSQVTGLENVTREDQTSPSLTQEETLSNTPLRVSFADLRSAERFGKARVATKAEQGSEGQAKSQHNGLFKVKAILTE